LSSRQGKRGRNWKFAEIAYPDSSGQESFSLSPQLIYVDDVKAEKEIPIASMALIAEQ
jgi:hypothetical protein